MGEIERVKDAIARIAGRPNNVTIDEIEWVVNQLGNHHGYAVGVRRTKHCLLFRVQDQRFGVNVHNPGSKQVKTYSVRSFLEAMIELGLYED